MVSGLTDPFTTNRRRVALVIAMAAALTLVMLDVAAMTQQFMAPMSVLASMAIDVL